MGEALTLTLWNSILPLAGFNALVPWQRGWSAGRGCLLQWVLDCVVVRTARVTLVVAPYAAITKVVRDFGRTEEAKKRYLGGQG